HPVVNGLVGEWSVSFIWNWQSGRPNMTFGNVYYDGDITQLKTSYTTDPTRPVFDTSGFYFHDAAVQTNGVDDPAKQRADQRIQLGNNVRYFPTTADGLRNENLHLLDLGVTKNFALSRNARMQVRIEFINALNYTVLFSPG